MSKLKVCVLISGRGSNMMALVDAAQAPDSPFEIVAVGANTDAAAGLAWAQSRQIPTFVVPHKAFGKDRESFDLALHTQIEMTGAQLVALAGFMRLLTPWFVETWRDRLVNIHPSLLPSFPGLHVQQQALDYGVKFSGCTVHYVRPETDSGPILMQAVVPVHQDDTADTLADRILTFEHKIYPHALRLIAEGRVNVYNDKTFIADTPLPQGITNPVIPQMTEGDKKRKAIAYKKGSWVAPRAFFGLYLS